MSTYDELIAFLDMENAKPLEWFTLEQFIAQHKHIAYCEAIISPEGEIAYVKPSHMISLCKVIGKSQEEIDTIIPPDAMPLEWLVDYTGYVAVYYNGAVLPKQGITEQQEIVLKELQAKKIILSYQSFI